MKLIDTIFLGLRKGYNKNLRFKNKQIAFESKMTEYILTMAVADELADYNNFGKRTSIEIEYPLYEFYNGAFAKSIWTNEDICFSNSEEIKREFNADPSEKRIDIAVMFDETSILKTNYRSLHGLEIKSINTNYSGIIKDLVRLSDAMITTSDITGKNSIDRCFSAFIKSYSKDDGPTYTADIASKQANIFNILNNKINSTFLSNPKYNILDYTIHNKDIESIAFEDYCTQNSNVPDASMFWNPNSETGHVFGIVIEIKRK